MHAEYFDLKSKVSIHKNATHVVETLKTKYESYLLTKKFSQVDKERRHMRHLKHLK